MGGGVWFSVPENVLAAYRGSKVQCTMDIVQYYTQLTCSSVGDGMESYSEGTRDDPVNPETDVHFSFIFSYCVLRTDKFHLWN